MTAAGRPVVLVTRPEPEATALARRLSKGGYAPLLSPMLEIRRADRITRDDLRDVRTVVLTSPRAAAALGEDLGPDEAILARLTAACVGMTTAEAARRAGVGQTSVGPGGAQALGRQLMTEVSPADGPLLLLQGRDMAVDLVPPLSAAGFSLRAKTVYAAESARGLRPEARDAFVEKRVAAVLLLSERTARGLADAIDEAGEGVDAENTIAVCISARTAEAAQGARFRQIVAAPRPDLEATLQVLDGILGGAAG